MKGHYCHTCFTGGYAMLILGKSSEREQEYILHFLSCALKVPLKCSSVTYLAIVPSHLLRSELLTTSE